MFLCDSRLREAPCTPELFEFWRRNFYVLYRVARWLPVSLIPLARGIVTYNAETGEHEVQYEALKKHPGRLAEAHRIHPCSAFLQNLDPDTQYSGDFLVAKVSIYSSCTFVDSLRKLKLLRS